ncbi:MAG: hypothetical protein ACK57T_17000 [Dolichospermum sp.]
MSLKYQRSLFPIPRSLRCTEQFDKLTVTLVEVFPVPCSLFPVPCSLFPVPCSLLPVPCSLLPVPCSLFPVPCSLVITTIFHTNGLTVPIE